MSDLRRKMPMQMTAQRRLSDVVLGRYFRLRHAGDERPVDLGTLFVTADGALAGHVESVAGQSDDAPEPS
jgi:hypothetical protein